MIMLDFYRSVDSVLTFSFEIQVEVQQIT